MNLEPQRVGPYVRALRAALDALAPNDDHVPLGAALRHLRALDPALSHDLLAPGEVVPETGMPAFPWMERVRAEAGLTASPPPSEGRIRRAEELDAALGARLRARANLHGLLSEGPILPLTHLRAAVKRIGEGTTWTLAYDRLAPDGRWVRIRAELDAVGRTAGPLGLSRDGHATVDASLQHTLTRHFATQLSALREVLGEQTGAAITRLSRGWVGPFWFPGMALPDDVPAALGQGLLLHAAVEVVARDVHASSHRDPWLIVPDGERVPEGYGVFRERRFAARGAAYEAARRWAERAGFRNVVVPVGRPRRRL